MPVVLMTVEGQTRSGHTYDDRTGVSYEYPSGRYERWIQTGDRFVYQRPRAGYTGCGIVGEIGVSATAGRLVCDVLSVVSFDKPVPLKDVSGKYYEADTKFWKDRVYWGQGVRPLADARFDEILAVTGHTQPAPSGYASPAVARAVEDYSIRVVMDQLCAPDFTH